jgi:DNA-binding transcriptional ArsR family regulator
LPIEQAELAVEVFRMLSDTTRVRLLWELIDQELAVNELAARVGKPAPSVSQHLAKLRMARLVRTRRERTQVFYRLENEHVAQLVRDAVYNAEHAGHEVPRHHVDDEHVAALESVPRSRSGLQSLSRSGMSSPAEQAQPARTIARARTTAASPATNASH